MKISVTTTTAQLSSILSVAQKTIARDSVAWKVFKNLFIKNEDLTISIFIELWGIATLTDWFELQPWDSIAIQEWNYWGVNLIASWATNENVKLLIN